MKQEWLELQSVIRDGSMVTDVKSERNRIYFKVDGHQFQTYNTTVTHEGHPLFNHPVSDYQARQHNTPEGIVEDEKRSEEIDNDIELFNKHKASLYKIIMLRGLELMTKKSDEAGIRYIDYHFDVMENGRNCQKLLKKLEDDI
jgi:hypothetical protein